MFTKRVDALKITRGWSCMSDKTERLISIMGFLKIYEKAQDSPMIYIEHLFICVHQVIGKR